MYTQKKFAKSKNEKRGQKKNQENYNKKLEAFYDLRKHVQRYESTQHYFRTEIIR